MMSKALMAKTHPPEYLMHKYWARKPHNIIEHYIRTYFKEGYFVADPFCGSGVFLAESRKQKLNCVGFDINPLACLLSDFTANPPAIEDFRRAIEGLINKFKDKYSHLYLISDKPIRFLVHEVVSKCGKCGQIGSVTKSRKEGTKHYCINCDGKLSFNLESFNGTEVIRIYDRNNVVYSDPDLLAIQKKLSGYSGPTRSFDKILLTNRRILAFPGMRVSDLFTPRAYSLISDLFYEAHQIENLAVRNGILLFLTSCVAQFSRLIPLRNNLTTGGPAWTVPGFWIAPLHLETNPIIHLEAKYSRFLRGLASLNSKYTQNLPRSIVKNVSAQDGLAGLSDKSLDGIFFDPPYGDNVPYVEYSEIWNAFLNKPIEYQKEIIVSDRRNYVSSWEKYSSDIKNVISLFEKKLKDHGKIIMTFNNLDPRAWRIVLGSFSDSSFRCIEAKYQVPAVVSSKAQMASANSYIGDYYCVFEKNDGTFDRKKDIYELSSKLRRVLLSRKGRAPQSLLYRIAILSILNENMDLCFIDRIEEALQPIAAKKGNEYHLRQEEMDTALLQESDLDKLLREIAVAELKGGKKTIQEFYEVILAKADEIGSPPLSEVKLILREMVYFNKDYCFLKNKNPFQPTLFDRLK
jgi:predicted RNA-binding Zn-ribbon protein involved in translation (DUF1610 family)